MSGLKHTPGPWRWDDSYSTIDGRRTWTLVGSDGSGILSCDGLANSPQEICCESEARLIAAAPCLLDALQRLNSATRRYMEERPESDAEWASDEPSVLSIVDAAIAKATGGAA